MTLEEIRLRIEAIQDLANEIEDFETAHAEEDQLYKDVLSAIADGAEDAKELAALAMTCSDLKYQRWYA